MDSNPRSARYLMKEENVVCRQRIYYMPQVNGVEVQCPGDLIVTNAQLSFSPAETGLVLVAVPLGCVEKVRRLKGKQLEFTVEISCKDLRVLRVAFPSKMAYKNVANVIRSAAYEPSIERLFAYQWRGVGLEAWEYDAHQEMERVGLASGEHRITNLNMHYKLCDSYPTVLAVPTMASDSVLTAVAKFRSRGRLPVATFKYAASQAAMYRCSQPLVGLGGKRSGEDEHLLAVMASLPAHRGEACTLRIVDARPKAAALGNKFRGAGVEVGARYATCELEFLNIGNIHVMRGSLQKLVEASYGDESDARFTQHVDNSHWKEHLSRVLSGACRISQYLVDGDPVLVHCTDGWDRTAQLGCLTQIMLDPYYRTIHGFAVLVEKEWVSFGHKFAQRHGHGTFAAKIKDNQRAPIFLQFLDCVWQLLQQFPLAFEFSERFLLVCLDASYSNVFGTFLCNTDQERRVLYHVPKGTNSLWSYVLHHKEHFRNPLYESVPADASAAEQRMQPKVGPQLIRFWKGLYQRYKFYSVNELEGLRAAEGVDLVTINSSWDRQLAKTHLELERARESSESSQPQQLPNKPLPLPPVSSPPESHLAAGHRGSMTLEELEYQQKRRSVRSLRRRGSHDSGIITLVLGQNGEEDELFIDMGSDESLVGISSQSSSSCSSSSESEDEEEEEEAEEEAPVVLTPRGTNVKRRGVKLSVHDLRNSDIK